MSDVPMLQQYQMLEVLMYLIMVDAKDQKLRSGLVANVHLLNQFLDTVELPLPWWLAGGISAEWIPELLNRVNPDGLDASSRLEDLPGRKNLEKVRDLIEAVQQNS